MVGRTLLSTTILAAILSYAAASVAQEPTAKERFTKGVKLFKQEDHAGALAEFLAAYKAEPHYSVLFNIAQCHAAIENNAEALSYFQQYMDEAGDSIPTQRKLEVVEEMDRLKTLLCSLDVKVSPPYAETLVDGKIVEDVAKTIYLDPGEHTLIIRMDGHVTVTENIVLTRGEPQSVEISLVPEATMGTVVVKSGVDDAYVYVDGEQVGPAPWEGALPPGEHAIAVKALGREDATDSINVMVGKTVMIKLEPAHIAAASTPVAAGKGKFMKSHKLAISAGVMGAVAAAGWVSVVIMGLKAMDEGKRLGFCQDVSFIECSEEDEDSHIENGKFLRSMTNLDLGLALGFSVLSIALGIASGAAKKKERQSLVVVSPYVDGAGDVGLTMQGVF